ncbi:TRAP transporter small permease [Ammoniphilus sp. 3BR4]|uniref:TRAP transporter small permease n=1 Tax=Ammoniphilus sp. 3BR4 TaxID=3158265 RepID=UPI0034658E66
MKWIAKCIHGMTVFLFVALVCVVFWGVIARALSVSAPWTEEASRFLFIWLSFVAGFITIRKGLNVCFDMIIDRLPYTLWKVVFTLVNVISIVFLVVVTIFSVKLVLMNMTQYSSVLHVPMGLIYLAIPVGSLGMIFAQTEYYLKQLKVKKEANHSLEIKVRNDAVC